MARKHKANRASAGNRWHLNCFRCNTCGTLLDSDANLLLLGDGSLICNNCTYSCSACNNKIEDLAILTGDQAFCATCFRCRNCKRKIENLRYARTSQGIFCMSCHESLMARRRKKSKTVAQAKTRNNDSPMVDKSLPALPPNAIPPNAFSDDRVSPDSDTPTELSPRPTRPTYPRKESAARGSPRPPRSPERHQDPPRETGLGLQAPPYRNNRNSSIFPGQAADLVGAGTISSTTTGADSDNGFFIPVALDPSPAASVTSPRSNTDTFDQRRATHDKDYFMKKNSGNSNNEARSSQASTPHIAFQEKVRRTSSDYEGSTPKEPSRKLSKSSRSDKSFASQSQQVSPGEDKMSRQTNGRPEEFKLQDAPKSKKMTNNKSPTHVTNLAENGTAMAADGSPRKQSPPRTGPVDEFGQSTKTREIRARVDDNRQPSELAITSSVGEAVNSRSIPRKEVPASSASRSGMCFKCAIAIHANFFSSHLQSTARRLRQPTTLCHLPDRLLSRS